MGYRKQDGALLHPIDNPNECTLRTVSLYKVRLDDRGDLCLYVFASSTDEAIEAGADHGDRTGGCGPDDLQAYEEGHGYLPDDEAAFVRAIAKLTAVADDHAEHGVDVSQDPTDAVVFKVLPGDNDEPGQEYPTIVTFSAYSWQEALAAVQATGIRVVRVVDVDSDVVWTAPPTEADPVVAGLRAMADAVQGMEPHEDQLGYPGSLHGVVFPPTEPQRDALGTFMGWRKITSSRRSEVVYLLDPAPPGRPDMMRIVEWYGRQPWEVQSLNVFDGWVTWVLPGNHTSEITIRAVSPEAAAQALLAATEPRDDVPT